MVSKTSVGGTHHVFFTSYAALFLMFMKTREWENVGSANCGVDNGCHFEPKSCEETISVCVNPAAHRCKHSAEGECNSIPYPSPTLCKNLQVMVSVSIASRPDAGLERP